MVLRLQVWGLRNRVTDGCPPRRSALPSGGVPKWKRNRDNDSVPQSLPIACVKLVTSWGQVT